jgi:hypothetical protein
VCTRVDRCRYRDVSRVHRCAAACQKPLAMAGTVRHTMASANPPATPPAPATAEPAPSPSPQAPASTITQVPVATVLDVLRGGDASEAGEACRQLAELSANRELRSARTPQSACENTLQRNANEDSTRRRGPGLRRDITAGQSSGYHWRAAACSGTKPARSWPSTRAEPWAT